MSVALLPGLASWQWRRRDVVVAVVAALWSAGCGGLLSSPKPVDLYRLSPPPALEVQGLAPLDRRLLVEMPLAVGGLDETRIAVRPFEFGMRYLGGVRWAAKAPTMLQSLLIQAFESTGKLQGVGGPSLGFRYDFRLATELRAFAAEYVEDQAQPLVRVRLSAKLLRGRELVASQSFEEVAAAEGRSVQQIVEAFDAATDAVVVEVVRWTLRRSELSGGSTSP